MALLLIHIKKYPNLGVVSSKLHLVSLQRPRLYPLSASFCGLLLRTDIPRMPRRSSPVSSFVSSDPEDCLNLTIHFSPLFMKFRQYGSGKACEHENGVDGSRDLDGHVCEYFGPKYT
jgi:hypothetical protein